MDTFWLEDQIWPHIREKTGVEYLGRNIPSYKWYEKSSIMFIKNLFSWFHIGWVSCLPHEPSLSYISAIGFHRKLEIIILNVSSKAIARQFKVTVFANCAFSMTMHQGSQTYFFLHFRSSFDVLQRHLIWAFECICDHVNQF